MLCFPASRALLAVVAGVVAGSALLTGCAGEKEAAAPVLPDSTCFGAFTPADLAPLMGTGKEVQVDAPADLRLTADWKEANCRILVDGQGRFSALATRKPAGLNMPFGPEIEKSNPEALPYAGNSRLWDTGAAVVLNCKGPTDSFDLDLFVNASVPATLKQEDRRPTFAALMKKFMDLAKQQNQCGG
ncbi:hypothetical protein [Streptomyces sp. NBC_01294]|uniref:hypothetical protein n=1 Tax=Streptomyces sp. NBC_01294 TaxID=2903815 RepID=UPI002DD91B0C|nr:hypothetical protein [Streptomyces sp. NBC_01294]WRZ59060.1 hypothetical protein OG534_22770 [Streptomyces sp. NBC_01294]